jgi:hypothetical protein
MPEFNILDGLQTSPPDTAPRSSNRTYLARQFAGFPPNDIVDLRILRG